MSYWQDFKGWIAHWFMHSNASNSGVVLTPPPAPATPAPATPAPATPAPAAPAPATPAPAAPAPAAPVLRVGQAQPVSETISTAESVVKLLGTAIGLVKNTGLLSSKGGNKLLPSGSNDNVIDVDSENPPSDVINDSSEVVD